MWATDRHLRFLVAGTLLALAVPGLGAQPSPVSDADIERVRRSQPKVTDEDIDAARRRYGVPDIPAPRPQTSPLVDHLPAPSSPKTVDVEALARGYAAASAEQMQAAQRSGSSLYVFVSLSVRDVTLQRLFDQARRAQAVIVLRGFKEGSLKQTVARIQVLTQGQPTPVQIDPRPFDRFSVTTVPSFVLLKNATSTTDCTAQRCEAPDGHWRIGGDVSLAYALEQIARSSSAAAEAAAPFLRRLDGSPR